MLEIDNLINEEYEDSLFGKKAIFYKWKGPNNGPGPLWKFSSTLDKIGYDPDREILDNTEVQIHSDIVELDHPKYGQMFVIKVQDPDCQTMWVLSHDLIIEHEKEC